MSYTTVEERIYTIAEAATPDVQPQRLFKRMRGKASADAVAATSGQFRALNIIPGSARRGTAVNGTGAKQVIQDLTLVSTYQDTGDSSSVLRVIEADADLLRSLFEDFRNYDFTTSKIQNLRVNGHSRVKRDGSFFLQMAITATYIAAN